jgi:hypothetical protein
MIIYVVDFASETTYFRCDYLQCSKVGAGRKGVGGDAEGAGVIRPPIGWLVPRRSGELVNPQVQTQCFCSFECLAANDGAPPESALPVSQPVRIAGPVPLPKLEGVR